MDIKIENFKGNIRLRFSYAGKRHNLSLGLKYTDSNIKEANKTCNRIKCDIDDDCFDISLSRYKKRTSKKSNCNTSGNKLLLDIWNPWLATLDLSNRTYYNHYLIIEKALKRDRPDIRNSVNWWYSYAAKYAPTTYNQRLSYIQACLSWGYTEKLIESNPLKYIKRKKNTRNKVVPFTKEEYVAIVKAFRENTYCSKKSAYKHSFYADYIEFLFKTGFRPSEAIGLRVRDINLDHAVITIDTVLARGDKGQSTSKARVRKETKTGDIRSIKINKSVLALLTKRIRTYKLEKDDLIFFNFSGNPINDRIVSQRYWKVVLQGLGLEHRKIYATKHTLATLALKEMTPSMVAKLLGHVDARMIYEHYGNIIDTPILPDL